MQRTFIALGRVLAAGILAGVLSCSAPQSEAPRPPAAQPLPAAQQRTRLRINPAKLAKALHERVNQERRRRGLPTYRWDAGLGRIAAKHSRDMAKRNYFGHVSPDGAGLAQRYLKEHYACGVTINGELRTGGEILYRGSLDAEARTAAQAGEGIIGSAIEAWTGSEADRGNVLSPDWQREGAGIVVLPDGTVLITVNFC